MRVRVTRIDPSLPLPKYASAGAAGFDLYAREDTEVDAGAIGIIPANVIIAVPAGHVLIVSLRSGTPHRTGLISPHGIGVIDQDYCGPADEVKILVLNSRETAVTVHRGERIAQGMIVPVSRVDWLEAPPGAQESRGGFGSTGQNS